LTVVGKHQEQPRTSLPANQRQKETKDEGSVEGQSFDYSLPSHRISLAVAFSILIVFSAIFGTLLPLNFNSLYSLPPLYEFFLFIGAAIPLATGSYFLISYLIRSINAERKLRISAQKSAREAQLLQDILTHDIRNYNQVSKMSAELIRDELNGAKKSIEPLITTLINSIDGSTQLVERAKMLGKVFSEETRNEHPVNILLSIGRSKQLVERAFPDRRVNAVLKIDSAPIAPIDNLDAERQPVEVMADELVDEVFTNLFSNSVKYTEEHEAFIAIEIKRKEYVSSLKKDCCKIVIADAGRGIPDPMKSSLFSRYLKGAKGSGLGLSIVHALVVGRYGGKIDVKDRVESDYTKGAMIEIFIPLSSKKESNTTGNNVQSKPAQSETVVPAIT